MSTERVIVQREASQALVSSITTLCKNLKAGDPTKDSTVKLSGLSLAGLAENVLSLVREAKDAGAEVLLGDLESDGVIIQPHLLTGVTPGMKLWDRESFGPGKSSTLISRLSC
jgi:acyl-CoA reductase-like NAD-dependent aldehyde dehydrogenase